MAYDDIDWSHPPEFLDNEFARIMRESEASNRILDKLVRVRRLDPGCLNHANQD
jgi:hypothetical protein